MVDFISRSTLNYEINFKVSDLKDCFALENEDHILAKFDDLCLFKLNIKPQAGDDQEYGKKFLMKASEEPVMFGSPCL